MALSADRQTRTRAGSATRTNLGDVAATKVIYFGAAIGKNAAGYVVPASDATAIKVVGIAQAFVDNTNGADGALTVAYISGVAAELDNNGGAIVQAGKHVRCYAADDLSVTSKALSLHKVAVGTVLSFTATKVWVYIDEALNPDDTAGVVANGAVSPAVLSSAPIEVIPLDMGADHATQTLVYINPDKIEIVDVVCIKDGAGAANTIQITDSADAAISDAIAFAVDKAVTRAGTLDKAKRTLLAGAGFKVVNTRAAGVSTGQVFLHVIKR